MSSAARPVIILLVEDSPDDVFFFRRAVDKAGITAEIHVGSDGVEAMDYLLHQGRCADAAAHPPPDIIFLDLKLPHCNGFELLEWMKSHAEGAPAPVVVLTSSGQAEDRERAEALGAALFLTKPASLEQLRQAMQLFPPPRPDCKM
jgi:CheY-like chemotaxis protein